MRLNFNSPSFGAFICSTTIGWFQTCAGSCEILKPCALCGWTGEDDYCAACSGHETRIVDELPGEFTGTQEK